MLQRIRFTKDGMEVETQEGDKIVEKFTVSWEVLREVINFDVTEYLRLSDNRFHRNMPVPKGVYEFSLQTS